MLIFIIGTVMPVVSGGLFSPEKTQIKVKAKGKTLYATLTTVDGKPLANKKIKFNVKGKTYYKVTNAKGTASMKFSSYSKMKTWKFKATYIGDKQYKTSSKVGKIPKPTIKITAKPSCGCLSKYSYKWRKRTFINRCPFCGKYGTLKINPKHVPESELTCSKSLGGCGADFCGNCGHDKCRRPKYLTRV